VIATLQRPVGVPLCDCGKRPPHATAWLAGVHCDSDYPAQTCEVARAALRMGASVEIVGDIVAAAERPGRSSLVSCFFWFDGAPRSVSVPDRATLPVNEHCQRCPTEAMAATFGRPRRLR
jgi:hypothetical protein